MLCFLHALPLAFALESASRGATSLLAIDRSTSVPAAIAMSKFGSGRKKKRFPIEIERLDSEGLRLLKERREAAAVKAFARSLRKMPGDPRALANRGLAYARLGKTAEALSDWSRAAAAAPELGPALRPAVVRARLSRGAERLIAGDVAAALRDFYSTIALEPKGALGYHAVALAALIAQRPDTCVGYESHALNLYPTLAEAYAVRGRCRLLLGRSRDSTADFRRAVALAPELREAMASLQRAPRSAASQKAAR